MAGPLTIELARKAPIFTGITPIRESQLPIKLPRMKPLWPTPNWVAKSDPYRAHRLTVGADLRALARLHLLMYTALYKVRGGRSAKNSTGVLSNGGRQ